LYYLKKVWIRDIDEKRESSEDFCTNSQIRLSEQRFTMMRNKMESLQIEQFTEGLLRVSKRVFEPKTKRRKLLKTLGFGKFGGFRKYKVQKTSPSLI